MSDIASAQVNETVTSVLFQLFEFAAGDAEPLTVGAVASRLIVTDCDDVPPALVAEHVKVVPAVSALTVVGSQPDADEIAVSLSTTPHVTVTSLTYQPLLPSVPVTFGVMTGGLASEGAAAMLKLTVIVAGDSLIVVFASNVSTIE